ncbi:MAG: hypothetical protein ACTSXZ_07265, partial [Alphaproteobacteria bacterium]
PEVGDFFLVVKDTVYAYADGQFSESMLTYTLLHPSLTNEAKAVQAIYYDYGFVLLVENTRDDPWKAAVFGENGQTCALMIDYPPALIGRRMKIWRLIRAEEDGSLFAFITDERYFDLAPYTLPYRLEPEGPVLLGDGEAVEFGVPLDVHAFSTDDIFLLINHSYSMYCGDSSEGYFYDGMDWQRYNLDYDHDYWSATTSVWFDAEMAYYPIYDYEYPTNIMLEKQRDSSTTEVHTIDGDVHPVMVHFDCLNENDCLGWALPNDFKLEEQYFVRFDGESFSLVDTDEWPGDRLDYYFGQQTRMWQLTGGHALFLGTSDEGENFIVVHLQNGHFTVLGEFPRYDGEHHYPGAAALRSRDFTP